MSSTSLTSEAGHAYKLFIYLNAGYQSRYALLNLRSRFADATDPRALARAQQIVGCVEEWIELLLADRLQLRDARGTLEPVTAQALNLGRLLGDEVWRAAECVVKARAVTESAATRESAWPMLESLVWNAEFDGALQPAASCISELIGSFVAPRGSRTRSA